MTDTPRLTLDTQYGKLVVAFINDNELRVLTTWRGNPDGEDYTFKVNGVRLKVEAYLHAPGSCTRYCSEGNHGPGGNLWGIGGLCHPELYSHHSGKQRGEVDGYSSYPTIRRYDDDMRSASPAAHKAVSALLRPAVTQLVRKQPWLRDQAQRVVLETAVRGAKERVEHLQAELQKALEEWQRAEDALAEFDRNSMAA